MFEIYDDRINIVSYGGLVGGLTEEEFFSGCSMPRNRELMRVFRDMELVENFGSGMHRILQAYDRSIFKISENFVMTEFKYDEEVMKQVHVSIGGDIKELGIARETVKRALKTLREKEIIRRVGSDKTGYYEVLKK